MTEFFRHFAQYIRLSDQLKDELTKRVRLKTFSKGEILHPADKVCTKSYFIQKGLLRLYFLKDGREISEYFSYEGDWTNSPRSFMQRKTDIYYIDAIEQTDVCILDVQDLMFLFDNFPEMERYSRLSMGSTFGYLIERITSMRFTTAKEKYDHFCEVYQGIHHRIPLGMVASYLGITQETLSRIRAEK
jgi:CRP-like cAMP-binding protein